MTVEDSGQGVSGEQPQGGSFDSSGTGNPAWNEMLSGIPQEYHSQMIPHLQKWDKGVQDRFQQVHSQYEGYKPFIENDITPDDIQFAMGLVNAINNDPKSVQEALNSWIEQENIQEQQAQGQPGVAPTGEQGQPDFTQHPEYQKMSTMVNSMADILLKRQEEEAQAKQDQELDAELKALHAKHGDFDDNFVIAQMLAGLDPDKAIEAHQNFVNQVLTQQRRPGPKLLGAGGALPSQQMNVREMDRKQTRNLVAEMLQQAQQQE